MSKAYDFGIQNLRVQNIDRNTNLFFPRPTHMRCVLMVELPLNSVFRHEIREKVIIYFDNASKAPKKLVSQSEHINRTSPLGATKRRNALTKLEELISSSTTIWTARITKQVNLTAHRFDCAFTPLIILATTPTVIKHLLQRIKMVGQVEDELSQS